MNLKQLLLFSVVLFKSGIACAQTLNTAKLDSFFNVLARTNQTRGSFAVAQKGKVVYTRSIGGPDVNENTVYHIGSVTKLFTATMIFQLIDEGKLALTTTLDQYYPQIPQLKTISIENLLGHSSGLYDFLNDNDDKTWAEIARPTDTILNRIVLGKPHFLPGTGFSYSNSGYWLLAQILQKVTGQRYEENLQKRICGSIGLKHTRSATGDEREAGSYSFTGQWKKIKDLYFPNDLGAGNILSTPTDLILFDEALLGGKLISAASLKAMQKNSENLGTGITRSPFYQRSGLGHSGDTYGTHSSVTNFAGDQLTAAYCINGEVYPHNEIDIALLKICFNLHYEIPSFNRLAVAESLLDKYAGIYSSAKVPIKITIIKNETYLLAQTEGEDPFLLSATAANKFRHDPGGITVEFDAVKAEMIFRQGGESYRFKKQP